MIEVLSQLWDGFTLAVSPEYLLYALAGSIVGMVEKGKIIDGRTIEKDDVLIGLLSNGLHTNGYSLARKVLFDMAGYSVNTYIDALGETVGEALLRVHRCYFPTVAPLLDVFDIRGMSHITGGGLIGNTKRILPKELNLAIDWNAWKLPPLFQAQ